MKALEKQNLKNQNDERLQVEAALEDPARFAELYENNFERVYAYIAHRVPNREEAQDATADVFHQALVRGSNGAACRSSHGCWRLRRKSFRIGGSGRPSNRKSQRTTWS